MFRSSLIAGLVVAGFIALAMPAAAQTVDPGPRAVVGLDRPSALSDLLVAADGKLVRARSIPELKAALVEGRGAWAGLSARSLAREVRALAATAKVAIGYCEADDVSRAAGGCCGGGAHDEEDHDFPTEL